MTVTVNCYTSGDVWVRQEEMIQTLYSIAPTTDVIIDTQFEGISLGASGILDAINQWVAETITRGESFFATEKTVRPIVGCRPFLLYGTVGFLKNLKQAGFRTFSELWSEDYDQFEGPERWNQIKLTIDLIVRDGYNIDLAREIVAYNYHYLSKCTEKKA